MKRWWIFESAQLVELNCTILWVIIIRILSEQKSVSRVKTDCEGARDCSPTQSFILIATSLFYETSAFARQNHLLSVRQPSHPQKVLGRQIFLCEFRQSREHTFIHLRVVPFHSQRARERRAVIWHRNLRPRHTATRNIAYKSIAPRSNIIWYCRNKRHTYDSCSDKDDEERRDRYYNETETATINICLWKKTATPTRDFFVVVVVKPPHQLFNITLRRHESDHQLYYNYTTNDYYTNDM